MDQDSLIDKVDKRLILYSGGYDPRGVRYYHRLYREEAAKQAGLNGSRIRVSPRKRFSKHVSGWTIRYRSDNADVTSDFHFLEWDDIIRNHWIRNPLVLYWKGLMCSIYFILTGTYFKFARLSWPSGVTGIYPLALLLMLTGLAVTAGYGIFHMASFAGTPHPAAITIATVFFVLVLYGGMRIGNRMKAFWLLRIWIFFFDISRQHNEVLDQRIDTYTDHLLKYLNDHEYDEILFVSHSIGPMVMVPVLARVAARFPDCNLSKLRLLTLGQSVPVYSQLPGSHGFREDMKVLSTMNLYWLNVTAPSDGGSIVLTDPFTGICDRKNLRLKMISPRYPKMFSSKKYQEIRQDRYMQHFMYMMTGDLPTDYDYFQITAGPQGLVERFADVESIDTYSKLTLFAKKEKPRTNLSLD